MDPVAQHALDLVEELARGYRRALAPLNPGARREVTLDADTLAQPLESIASKIRTRHDQRLGPTPDTDREGLTELSRTTVSADGMDVDIVLSHAVDDGKVRTVLTIEGRDTVARLEGEMPGEYWLVPAPAPTAA